jgi:hypothetical protein
MTPGMVEGRLRRNMLPPFCGPLWVSAPTSWGWEVDDNAVNIKKSIALVLITSFV